MRRYETIVIVDPDLGEEQRGPVFDRIRELIPQKGGLLVAFDEWGGRKLAYEIKKKQRGYFVRVDYCGGGDLVSEMERQFRIDDRVMKYMTVLLEKEADIESIQESMAPSEAEAKPAAETQAAEAVETPAETTAAETPPAGDPEPAPETTESEVKKEEV